jgi:peptide/nickel transport system permease protein
MLSEGQALLRTAWWVTTFPGLAIMLTVMAINLMGDGLRDVLDPRLKL